MTLRRAIAAPAICLATSAAFAQSGVTIDGLIDIGLYRDTHKEWKLGPIQRSNLAFRGVEDLGGGLAATFALNLRFETNSGELEQSRKPFFYGESTVGLKGSLGSVRLGRANDAMYDQDYKFDAWGNFDRVASPAWDFWHYNYPSDPRGNDGTPEYGRLNNGVFYDSPDFNGFRVHLSTAVNESGRDFSSPGFGTIFGTPGGDPVSVTEPVAQPWGISLNYDSEAWAAMLARERNSDGNTDTFVGLRGTLGELSVYGAWDRSEAFGSVARALTLSAQYLVGVVTLRAGWGRLDLDGQQERRIISAGAVYSFSKRTSVYVDVAGKRRDATGYRSTYGVGMAHNF